MILPKLSIVIPCYNAERYIENCLDSIILSGRGCESHYEIIVVNDGSTDLTACVLNNYTGGKIKVLTTNNNGVSSARNRGMDEACGEYIWFIDADDDIEPDSIPLLLQAVDTNNPNGVVFNFEYIKGENKQVRKANHILDMYSLDAVGIVNNISTHLFGLSQRNIDCLFRGEFIHYNRGFWAGGTVWQFLLKRSILQQNGLKFREKLPVGEDVMFLLRYLCVAENLQVVKNLIYNYYERPSGSLRTIKENTSLLFKSKMMLVQEREVINNLYKERYGRDMSACYDGSLFLSAMELCVVLSSKSLNGISLFLQYTRQRSVQNAIYRISTHGAPLKYRVLKMLLCRCAPVVYLILWAAQKMGYRVHI